MRKAIIVAVLVSTAAAAPATARNNSPYLGIDLGVLKPSTLNLDFNNNNVSVRDAERLKSKVGYDIDALLGYDFGMFRLEGELGFKHAGFKSAVLNGAAVAATNGGTQANPNYDATGRANIFSGMINALLDIRSSDGFNGSVGVGVGEARARVRAGLIPSNALNFRSQDTEFAWQLLAELRAPVSSNVDVGLKYRYFHISNLDLGPFCRTSCGATPPFRLHGKYRSNSLLASLVYNFGGASAPPPPPAPPPGPPPPPPPAPATQTCPDGSVIPAASTCPAPPPPPPPPPAPERG